MHDTPRKGLILLILAMSQMMVILDASIVNVALRAIREALEFDESSLQWIVTAYALAFGGFLLLGGRAADRLGRKRVFMGGLVLFIFASTIGGFAQNQEMLVAARALQGLGGAFMSPAALSLLSVIFREGEERNRALGVWGGVAASGGAVGVLLGGVLVEYLDWRWCLWVNVPIGLIAIAATAKFVPESRDENAQGFDVAGAVTATGGLVALVYALVRGNELGWASAQTVSTFVVAAVLLGTFVALQKRLEHPLMPPRLFKKKSVMGANLAVLLLGAGIFAMFFYVSLYLQTILNYSAIRTGLAFLPVTFAIGLSAGVTSKLISKTGPRPLATTGLLLGSIGMLLFMRINPGGDYLSTVLLPIMVVGLGMGLAFVSLTASALAGVPEEDSGLASAVFNTGQQVGGSVGLALLTAVFTARVESLDPQSPVAAAAATTSGWAWGFAVAAALLFAAAIVANTLIRVSPEEAAVATKQGASVG